MKYAELKAMTDDELIIRHDAAAANTVYGVQWYVDELSRRRADKATEALVRLTAVLNWLTVVVALFTAASTAATIYAVT